MCQVSTGNLRTTGQLIPQYLYTFVKKNIYTLFDRNTDFHTYNTDLLMTILVVVVIKDSDEDIDGETKDAGEVMRIGLSGVLTRLLIARTHRLTVAMMMRFIIGMVA